MEGRLLGKVYLCASRLLLNPGHLSDDDLRPCRELEALEGRAVAEELKVARELVEAYRRLTEKVARDPLGAEEEYISAFELAPRCPLYLTHYTSGDERERVAKMLSLSAAYRRAGLVARGELPDYLPLVLEFLAIAEEHDPRLEVIRTVLPGLKHLLDCVEGLEPYHRVVHALVALLELELGGGERDLRA